jgi:hypothetical protein
MTLKKQLSAFEALVIQVDRFPESALSDPQRYSWMNGRPLAAQILMRGMWHPYGPLSEFHRQHNDAACAARMQQQLVGIV